MKFITKTKFRQEIAFVVVSVKPEFSYSNTILDQWYERYFKYYTEEQIRKICEAVIPTGNITLDAFLEGTKLFFSEPLHKQDAHHRIMLDRGIEKGLLIQLVEYLR